MEKFQIILPYDDKMVLANVRKEANAIETQFYIEFPDGYSNTFFTTDASECGWYEETLGETELAKTVAPYLEEYLYGHSWISPVILEVNHEAFTVQPKHADKEMHYSVYQHGELLFVLRMGDESWEADIEAEPDLIKAIAVAIEARFM